MNEHMHISNRSTDTVKSEKAKLSGLVSGTIFDKSRPLQSLQSLIDGFLDLVVHKEPAESAVWCAMRPRHRPSITLPLVQEANVLHHKLAKMASGDDTENFVPKFYVMTSDLPGIFNLGGDLQYFLDCIKTDNRQALYDYAHGCVRCVFDVDQSLGGKILTVGVVQGDALGGGMEAALSYNILIAERGTKMGLPETLFNTFPGMGAYSLLSRKIGQIEAEKMILSGKMYLAEELSEIGLVDILAKSGEGIEAARHFVAENQNRHALLLSLNKVRRRVSPLTLAEL
jgi:DSF synthase